MKLISKSNSCLRVATSAARTQTGTSKRVIIIGAGECTSRLRRGLLTPSRMGWPGSGQDVSFHNQLLIFEASKLPSYLKIDPKIHLTIIDSEKTVGGVWCKERCFPGFLADSPSGLFDLSDLAMRDAIGLPDWKELPGIQVHGYLHTYAENFGLLERMRLKTRVLNVRRNEDGKAWDLRVENSDEVLTCDRLVVASGLNSRPKWPDLQTKDFSGLVIHSKEVGYEHQNLISEKVNRVTVYGGCKSGEDTIALCVNAGKTVDWVIRDTGNGPGTMLNIKQIGDFNPARLAGRWKSIISPTIYCTSSSARDSISCQYLASAGLSAASGALKPKASASEGVKSVC